MKRIIRLGLVFLAGLAVGRIVLALVPDGAFEFVKAAPTTLAERVAGTGESGAFALTISLIAVCTALLVCCYLIELTTLLIAAHKIRKDESTELAGRTLDGLQRIAAPVLVGALGGLLIVSLAFDGHGMGTFTFHPWIGAAAVLGVLLAAFIRTTLKKKVLEQVVANKERKD